jgi:carboxylesterase type B
MGTYSGQPAGSAEVVLITAVPNANRLQRQASLISFVGYTIFQSEQLFTV